MDDKELDEALAEALRDGLIEAVVVDGETRYRVTDLGTELVDRDMHRAGMRRDGFR